MNKLRVAVIGCGRISNVYREAFHELSDEIQVVGAADKVLERAEKFASEFPGCKPVETLEELLAEMAESAGFSDAGEYEEALMLDTEEIREMLMSQRVLEFLEDRAVYQEAE